MTGPTAVAGLGAVAARFDAVLFDQFGVLHDGRTAFPGAVEAARRAKALGVKTAVLSNSGKRAAANAARLAALGFAPALFDAVVTSGEACRARLIQDLAEGVLPAGAAVFVIARGRGADMLDGVALRLSQDAAEADAAVIAGREPERFSIDQDMARLGPLIARGAPAYCANPDRVMYADMGLAAGAGALAEAYAAAGGGPVAWFGKPHRAVFDTALDALGRPEAARTLMVGDSPEHDVAGAQALGCATLLITSGPQSHVCADARPDFTLPRLVW